MHDPPLESKFFFEVLLFGLLARAQIPRGNAAVQFCAAIQQRNVVRCLFSVGCVFVTMAISSQATSLSALSGMIPFHIMLAAVLLIGAMVRDNFGKFVQYVGAVMIAMAGAVSAIGDLGVQGDQPSSLELFLWLYPILAVATAAAYGYIVRNRWFFISAAVVLTTWLMTISWNAYRGLRQALAGLDYLFFGLLLFLMAMLISLNKARVSQQWFRDRRNKSRDVRKPASDLDA